MQPSPSLFAPLMMAAAGSGVLLAATARTASCQGCESATLGRVLDAGVEGPNLWTESGPPVVGRSFSLRVSNGTPHATGVLGWSLRSDPRTVPFARGLVYPGLPLALEPFVLDERGSSPALLRSPPVPPGLCGVEFYAQAGLVGSPPRGGAVLTNALHLRVGGPSSSPFGAPKIVLTGSGDPFDMNRDGLTDFVVRTLVFLGGGFAEQFFVQRNLGDGSFSPGPVTQLLDSAFVFEADFIVADFNGDGFGDVARAGILLTGDVESRLTPRGPTFASALARPRAVGDLNSDGWPDLVGSSSGLVTALNKEGIVFVPRPAYPIEVGRVALGHFDADRTLDAAVSHPTSPEVTVLFGNGDGTFRSGTNLATADRVEALSARDLDGDGFDELICALHGRNELHVQRCVGGGFFEPAVVYPVLDPVTKLDVLDLDGDGREDLVANRSSVFSGRGDGTFAPPKHYGISNPTGDALLDVDRDGRMDVLGLVGSNGTVYRGLPDGLLSAPRRPLAGLSAGEGAQDIATGDLDGDGLSDLVVPDHGIGEVLVVRTLESGLFAPPRPVGVGNGPQRVALGDLDGDGDLDAAVGHSGQSELAILRGDGAGALELATSHPMGGAASELALDDLNADGQLDLIASHMGTGAGFSVALGNGDGTFQASQTRAVTGESVAVVTGRFLGSPAVDVLVLRSQPQNYAVLSFPGNGDGTFGNSARTFTTHAQAFVIPRHMTAADGDLDGDPDLFISAFDGVNQFELLWTTNASGTFTTRSRLLRDVRQHAVADFSGDGLPDIVATNRNLGVNFFAGDGAMGFPDLGLFYSMGFRNGPIAIGDFDRNGTPDIAVVNEGSRDVWVALNHLGE